MREHPEPRPRDHTDAAQAMARDLAEIASHIGQLKGDANAYLRDSNYNALRLRLEAAAVEARRRVRLNEGRKQCAEAPGEENYLLYKESKRYLLTK